ncbi:MAG: hypothetical protein WB760_32855 [Xanthobacteraceae bacterium]
MSDTPTPVIDGVDVGKLLATVADIKTRPSPADFTFRAGMDVTRGAPKQTPRFLGAGGEDASRSVSGVLAALMQNAPG